MQSSGKYVVDTSVVIERIIKNSPHKLLAENLFNRALKREVELYVTLQTLSEVLYIASRIYSLSRVSDPNKEAESLILWLTSRTRPIAPTFEIALRAGELKKELGFSITDCYVIAAAEHIGGKALFLKLEDEMKERMERIKDLPVEFMLKNI
ncbi:MAG: type II toxin-antitoxin system VapC family toxin [Candidatus Methanodesulfokora sp.]